MKVIKFLTVFFTIMTVFVSVLASEAKQRPVIELRDENTVVFDQSFTASTVDTLMAAIFGKAIIMKGRPLFLVIDSGGGSVPAAIRLKAFIAQVPGLIVVCKGCDSSAAMIFVSAPKRLVSDNSVIMFHESFYNHITARWLKNKEFTTRAIKEGEEFDKINADAMHMSIKEYQDKIANTEWTLSDGDNIVKTKAADGVADFVCDAVMSELLTDMCKAKIE
jgi:ATP-dependent protease ClpP protease subunit